MTTDQLQRKWEEMQARAFHPSDWFLREEFRPDDGQDLAVELSEKRVLASIRRRLKQVSSPN